MAATRCTVVVPPQSAERQAHRAGGLHAATATALSSAGPTSTTIAAVPGLRSSCETCAASKLKCSKDRPSCARCVKRGLDCTYVLLKRAGRKPGQAQTSSRPRRRPPSSTGPSPPSGLTSTSTSTDMLRDLFGTSLDMAVDGFDAAMSGSSSLHCGDLLDHQSPSVFMTDPFSIHDGLDGEQLHLIPDDDDDSHSMLDVPPLVNHASMEPRTPQAVSTLVHDSQLLWTGWLDGVSCSCSARLLSLFKRYSASSERLCMHQRGLEFDEKLENVSTPSIFGQNETAVELLGGMLDCPCFQDGYLVVMMAMVMFKILGWYAAVAQRTKTLLPGEDHIPLSSSYGSGTAASSVVEEQTSSTTTTIRGFCLDGQDAERRTAQLILGELHRVRQLIDRFAVRLKLVVKEIQDADRARVAAKGLCASATLPLSTLVYIQLETDLRSEWRTLSARVIDRLKKL